MKTQDLLTIAMLGGLAFLIFRKPPEQKKEASLADVAKLVAAVAALKKALGSAKVTIEDLRTRMEELHKGGASSGGPVDEYGNPYGSGSVDGW